MSNAIDHLLGLASAHNEGRRPGITSVCTAHPDVIAVAMHEGLRSGQPVLIEATCNQVNQDGGYTGMTPALFRDFVLRIARRVGLPDGRLILGGDHLGPNPWRARPAAEAMDKALSMVEAYVAAGFRKIHLDASMACADDAGPLPAAVIAERATRLAVVAEATAKRLGLPAPAYIVGTEVPVPGGAAELLGELEITRPTDAGETIELHHRAFAEAGIADAVDRIIGLVVQPGVEFGHQNVIAYEPDKAVALSEWRTGRGFVFEAHSTDYQTTGALTALVRDGFAILKVGPGLTFALREALYGLDQIAGELDPAYQAGSLRAAMEQVMLDKPKDWQAYYHGTPVEQHVLRHYSYSDRIRYYWPDPGAQSALNALETSLGGQTVPETLVSQFLPRCLDGVLSGSVNADRKGLLAEMVRLSLDSYTRACTG